MRLWIMSDLHLEMTRGWDLPPDDARPDFDVMIVAGDLITRMERGVKWLLERVPDRPVIYVPGNHEGYGTDIDRTVEKARIAAANTNIHVMQNDAVEIGGVTFIAATLWTDFDLFGDPYRAMDVAAETMNDYRKIRKGSYLYRLRPSDTLARHMRSRDFIARELRLAKTERRVVISHHGPHPRTIKAGFERDLISAAYVSDLTDLMTGAGLWIYGHTHESRDFVVGSTRVVSNAQGYGPWSAGETWDNASFNPNFVIEI